MVASVAHLRDKSITDIRKQRRWRQTFVDILRATDSDPAATERGDDVRSTFEPPNEDNEGDTDEAASAEERRHEAALEEERRQHAVAVARQAKLRELARDAKIRLRPAAKKEPGSSPKSS